MDRELSLVMGMDYSSDYFTTVVENVLQEHLAASYCEIHWSLLK